MKRFMVFANSMNELIGKESTMERAMTVIKKKSNGHGNILELSDNGDGYKVYGIRRNAIKICRKLI